MAYPIQPPVENAWQIAGNALMQGGGVLGSMSDMIEKRKMALIAQRQAEIEDQQKSEALEMQKELQKQQIASSKSEMDLKSKDEARKARQAENITRNANIIGLGKPVPVDYQTEIGPQLPTMEGSPLNRNVDRDPYNMDEILFESLINEAITPEKYAEETRDRKKALRPTYKQGKDGYIYVWDDGTQSWDRTNLEGMPPQSSIPSYLPIVTTDASGQPTTAFVNQKDPNKVIRPDLPKPVKDTAQKQAIKARVATMKTARNQYNNILKAWNKIKGSKVAGPLGQGKIPSDAGNEFDSAVDIFRQTMRALTRTPGEGSMSDYETKLNQLPLPDRNRFESRTQADMQNLDDLISTLETGYGSLAQEHEVTEEQPLTKPSNMSDEQYKRYLELKDKKAKGTLK